MLIAETAKWWNDARIAELMREWEKGTPGSKIAVKMGTTRNAIIGKAHRLGLLGRPDPIRRDPNMTQEEKLRRRHERSKKYRADHRTKTPKPKPVEPVVEFVPPTPVITIVEAPLPEIDQVVVLFPVEKPIKHGKDPVPLELLNSHECKWPVEERSRKHYFCGDKVQGSDNYCITHKRLASSPKTT